MCLLVKFWQFLPMAMEFYHTKLLPSKIYIIRIPYEGHRPNFNTFIKISPNTFYSCELKREKSSEKQEHYNGLESFKTSNVNRTKMKDMPKSFLPFPKNFPVLRLNVKPNFDV